MTRIAAADNLPPDSNDSDAANWAQLQELFQLAEDTPAADRERVLEEHCPDRALRDRAMAIFSAAQERPSAFESAPPDRETQETETPERKTPDTDTLEINPQDSNQRVFLDANGGLLSTRIGPYSLVRHLGSGGLGSVYLVERLTGGVIPSVIQRSALKVLAPHAAGPSFIERFHREQHILASLDHPNITRMLDAGISETGQPYLVMEYVDGIHFDAYCNQQRLGIEARLALFLRVCDAVAYAHRNLVVHLDLKPSNILVTVDRNSTESGTGSAGGTVKLLDFGTSKLLRTDDQMTTTVLATPAYASPEQLRNEPVTTACDVYSLGAILFELLAGRRPGDSASVAMMLERAMREQAPEHLPDAVTEAAAAKRGMNENRLRQMLRGDLDTIVAKCLSPRPKDRYTSVDALADDITRYTEGRPILARPQTTLYRLGKFIRRHRSAVAATILVALALIASLGYAEWRQRQALHEGQRALRMQTFMYRLFKLANSSYTGKPAATVPEFLELGVKVLPEYIKEPADLREARLSLAESMFDNGDLKGAQPVFTQVISDARAAGDVQSEAEAEAFAGEIAYELAQMDQGAKLTASAYALTTKTKVSPTVRVWSEIYYAMNREKNGYRTDDNLRILQNAATEARTQHLPDRETAYALYQLAEDYQVRGRLDEAEQLLKEDIAIYNNEPYAVCDQSQMYEDMAYMNTSRNDLAAALPLYQKAYEGLKACSGPEKRNTLLVQALMAGAMTKVGQSEAAIPILEASLPAWRKVADASPDLFSPLYYLSSAYSNVGRFTEAEVPAKELTAILQAKVAPNDRRIGASQFVWARALAGQHRYKEALPHAEIACKLVSQGVTPYARRLHHEATQLLEDIQANLRHSS
jgi:serine/threonine-protein kinase